MQTQQALQTRGKPAPERPVFVEAEKLFDQMKEFSQTIAKRAYEFFEARGREWGHELEDWFRAESEFLRHIPVEVKENGEQITVRAEAPGFNANEIKVSIEPRWAIISGKTERKKEEENEKTVYSEFRSNQFCRKVTLPAEVDPAKTTASIKDGVLELTMMKAPAKEAVNVEVKTT